ncbi:PASTA domain-containing protein [Bacillus sp. BS98]|uniref:PASTA domain-containing protein n=1 Tax=Bacillus sp. BS98 TaxID=2608254 RepID=UPI00122F8D81|nr:PASTA domain-containing protein [Bacillus sp. BS98]QEQ20453.1 hypothetical protein F0362_28265 [Bacillus sp. BS98]
MPQVIYKEFNREEIGMGFNTQSGLAVGTALDVGEISENKVAPGSEVLAEITIINTHEEIMDKLGMSFGAQGRYGFFSASAKAKFSESTNYNSTSTFLVARCIVQNSFIRGKNFHLKPGLEEVLTTPPFDKFSTAFGDSFVRGLQTGGEYYCVIRITSFSESTQSELAAELKAEFDGIVTGIGFEAAYNKANANERTKSEFTATMYQRAGIGEEISPTISVKEAKDRFKQFPKIAKANPVAYETEIASYDTLALPVPSAEEKEDFLLALRDAREKKLYYIQKKNDFEFAYKNPHFFEMGPKPEDLLDAINVYTKLANAAMDHAIKISRGKMEEPKLFVPSINEPNIKLKRRIASFPFLVPSGMAPVPYVTFLPVNDAIERIKHNGLIPKLIPTFVEEDSTVIKDHVEKQSPDPGAIVRLGSYVEIYYNTIQNRGVHGPHLRPAFPFLDLPRRLYEVEHSLSRTNYRQFSNYGHSLFHYPYSSPGFIACQHYNYPYSIRTVTFPFIPKKVNPYSLPIDTYYFFDPIMQLQKCPTLIYLQGKIIPIEAFPKIIQGIIRGFI